VIVNFKSTVLEQLWVEGDVTLLPSTYVYEVIEILTILDASEKITDVELLGGFKIDEYKSNNWAVTVTVNNVEPIGSVTCLYSNGNAHDVDLNEYD
jgi:plasmid maintenance system killer protein